MPVVSLTRSIGPHSFFLRLTKTVWTKISSGHEENVDRAGSQNQTADARPLPGGNILVFVCAATGGWRNDDRLQVREIFEPDLQSSLSYTRHALREPDTRQ